MTGASTPGDGYGAGKCADCRREAFAACFRATAKPISEDIRDTHNAAGSLVSQMNGLASGSPSASQSADWNAMNSQLSNLDSKKTDLQGDYDAAVQACRQEAVEKCKDCGGGGGDDDIIGYPGSEPKIINCKGREVPFTNPARDNADEIWKKLFRDADGIPIYPTKETFFAWQIALQTDPRELFSRRSGVTKTREFWPGAKRLERSPYQTMITAGESVYDNCCNWYSTSTELVEEYTTMKEVMVFDYDFIINMTDVKGLGDQMSIYLDAAGEFIGGGAGSSAAKLMKDALAEAAAAGWLGNGDGAKLAKELAGDPNRVGDAGDIGGGIGDIDAGGKLGGKVGAAGDALGQGTAAVKVGADAVEYLAHSAEGLIDLLDGEIDVGVPRMTGAHHWSFRVKGTSFLELGSCEQRTSAWIESIDRTLLGVFPCSATTGDVLGMSQGPGNSGSGGGDGLSSTTTRTRDQQNQLHSQARPPNTCFKTEGDALISILFSSNVSGFDPLDEHTAASAAGDIGFPALYDFISNDVWFTVNSSGELTRQPSQPSAGIAFFISSNSISASNTNGWSSSGNALNIGSTGTFNFTSPEGIRYRASVTAMSSGISLNSFASY